MKSQKVKIGDVKINPNNPKVKCLTQNNRPFIMNTEVLTDLLQIIE